MALDRPRLGGVLWILTAEFFAAQAIAQAAWPEYSMADQDISLLGAITCGTADPIRYGIAYVCSPLNAVFNGGLVLVGLLIVAGVVLTRRVWPRGMLTNVALSLIGIGGIGATLAGLAPLDANGAIHSTGAALNFVVANIGIILIGVAIREQKPRLAAYSVLTGIVCLTGLALYLGHESLGLPRGILERITAYPQTIWFIVFGTVIAVRGGSTRNTADYSSSSS